MRKPAASALAVPQLLNKLGRGAPVSMKAVGGGCIARASIATFADGLTVFVKTKQGSPGMFEREAEGLAALAEADAIRVPAVLAVGEGVLVLEAIQSAPKCAGFAELFGEQFASLHRHQGSFFGFYSDNFIGATEQLNSRVGNGDCWPDFFFERRLLYQVKLAARNGYGHELQQLLLSGQRQILELLAASDELPSILHGDLWGGNYLADEQGRPCLIDPAVYFGHREADLAMTRLFGGFEAGFYRAYNEAWPLAPGHEERLHLYQLYHLLNHLNLFGMSYYGQCRQILQRYA